MMISNSHYRFGSAGFAQVAEISRAGMFRQTPDALLVGFWGKRPIWYSGAAGLTLTAGARSGKLKDVLGFNICCGIHLPTMLILDMKGELAAISQNQTPDKKHCIYWNPAALHGLPQHRVHITDYLRADSPTLEADIKVLCESLITGGTGNNGEYFVGRAREITEALIVTLVLKVDGELFLHRLYGVVNALADKDSDSWLDFAYLMNELGGFPARIEAEIANAKDDQSGGWSGILGEIFRAFAPLSDPLLLASISPPFDFQLSRLCEGSQTYNFYMMPPAEFISPWSPIIKAMLAGAMIHKSRKPHAPRQTWVIDEAAQLGKFDLLLKLYTYGAGIGIRPWTIWQSTKQMNAAGTNAETIITSSAQLRSYFGVRDFDSAQDLSRMIGYETLEYDDVRAQEAARLAQRRAAHNILQGKDLLSESLSINHHRREAIRKTKQKRLLRTPEEILETASEPKQFIFTDAVAKPIYADRRAFFDQRFMAGRHHPNPYHPPADKVRVKTWWGHRWRKVIDAPVPPEFADYPQYQSGRWSFIQ